MNSLFIKAILGRLLVAYSLFMLVPFIYAVSTGDGMGGAFATASLATFTAGFYCILNGSTENKHLKIREGYVVVMAIWLLAWFFGALPFLFTGAIPHYIDAAFETISSLTTTGASVISDWTPVADSVILWRGIMHWLGGMGIVVLFVAVLPGLGVNAFNLFKTEMAGPVAERVVPRIRDTARTLWIMYVCFTFTQMFLLKMAGMTFFDAFIHSVSTIATCGFSQKTTSIAFYHSTPIELIIVFFMILAGGNFALYFHAWHRGIGKILQNTEFKVYLSFIGIVSCFVAADLFLFNNMEVGRAFKNALFQVASLITTTGFTTDNYDLWPAFSRKVLFFLMFVGACAGSTSGGIKFSRFIILFKAFWAELKKMLHPRVVTTVHIDNKPVDSAVIFSVLQFFFLYITTFVIGVLLISFTANLQPFETFSLAAASLSNIGLGFGAVGPAFSYGALPDATKVISCVLMLLGRLELFPVLVFLMPEFWRRKKGW
jgi:trk system potassium uptake protein TrkH